MRRSVPLRDGVGTLLMLGLAGWAAVRLQDTGRLYFLLVAFRNLLLAFFYIRREASRVSGPRWHQILALTALSLPLAYGLSPSGMPSQNAIWIANGLAVVGYAIATLAAIDLGNRFALAPSLRGTYCNTGLYRYLRHPMYFGYAIAESGWLLLSMDNLPIYVLSVSLQMIRAQLENRLWSIKRFAPA